MKHNKTNNGSYIKLSRFLLLLFIKIMISGTFGFLFVVFFHMLFEPMDIWFLLGMTVSFIISAGAMLELIYTIIYYFIEKDTKIKPLFWDDYY